MDCSNPNEKCTLRMECSEPDTMNHCYNVAHCSPYLV